MKEHPWKRVMYDNGSTSFCPDCAYANGDISEEQLDKDLKADEKYK
jgi:hypothetical protein